MIKKIMLTVTLTAFAAAVVPAAQALTLTEIMTAGAEAAAVSPLESALQASAVPLSKSSPETESTPLEAALQASAKPVQNAAQGAYAEPGGSSLEDALQAAALPNHEEAEPVQGEISGTPFTYTSEGFGTFSGSGTATAEVDAPINEFEGLYMGGASINPADYSASETKGGETIVTLNAAFLRTLPPGEYHLAASFAGDYSADLLLRVNEAAGPADPSGVPPTGDSAGYALWIISMTASAFGCGMLLRHKKRAGLDCKG